MQIYFKNDVSKYLTTNSECLAQLNNGELITFITELKFDSFIKGSLHKINEIKAILNIGK